MLDAVFCTEDIAVHIKKYLLPYTLHLRVYVVVVVVRVAGGQVGFPLFTKEEQEHFQSLVTSPRKHE